MVAFGFLPQNVGSWWGLTNVIEPFLLSVGGDKNISLVPPSRLSRLVKPALIFISFDDKSHSRFLSVYSRSRSQTFSSSIDLIKSIICNKCWKFTIGCFKEQPIVASV